MAKKRIMVVDDDEVVLGFVKRVLEQTGHFEVQAESKARRAKQTAQRFLPDLILMDVIMPDMDGGSVVSEIRQDPRMREIPIIFLSGIMGKGEASSRGGKIGGNPILAKPVTPLELVTTIEKALS